MDDECLLVVEEDVPVRQHREQEQLEHVALADHRSLDLVAKKGAKAGLVLNPATPLALVEPVLGDIDLVLVMSVNPGFGGQAFIESQLAKIAALRKAIDALGKPIDLEVDGGVNPETARRCIAAGADALVAGTAVFKDGPSKYAANIQTLRG